MTTLRSNRSNRFLAAALAALTLSTLAPSVAHADDKVDTVFLSNGGRLRGTVIEEDPKAGVTIRLLDGTMRKVKPSALSRVEYGGESTSAPAPTQTPAVAPRPEAAPAAVVTPPPAWPPPQVVGPVAPAYPSYGAPQPWAEPVATHRRSTPMMITGLVLTGASVVTLLAGVALWVAYSNQESNSADGCGSSSNWCGGGNPQTYQSAGIAMFVLTPALLGAGIPLFLVGKKQVPDTATEGAAPHPWTPTISIGKNTVGLRFTF